MKKSLFLRLTILLAIISTLAGCIWVEPINHRGDRDRGGHHRGKH